MCVWVYLRLSSVQVWGREEDVGEVLFLNVFVFSSHPVWSRGFGATEGKINREQTSPGTQTNPRGILGMWLGTSRLPFLPHPENCPLNPTLLKVVDEFDLCSIIRFFLVVTHLIRKKKEFYRPLTWHTDLKLPTLSKPTLDDATLACWQRDLQPHKQLEVGLLLEQVAPNHSVIVSHLRGTDRERGSMRCSAEGAKCDTIRSTY